MEQQNGQQQNVELLNEIGKLMEQKNKEMTQKNEENIALKEKNAKLEEEIGELKEKLAKIEDYMKKRKISLPCRKMPAELLNELFGSLPMENAFHILTKMPNGLLARNFQKMINGTKKALKNNKLNCGKRLAISEEGFVVKLSGQYTAWNSVHAKLPIPLLNLKEINKPIILFYFEVKVLTKAPGGYYSANFGFCPSQFPSQGKWFLNGNNTIRIPSKYGIWIDQSYTKFGNDKDCFNKGDFVGLGIIHHPNSKMECFVTCNDKLLGKAKLPAKFLKHQIFPAVTLNDASDSIRLNFGKEEWQFKEFGLTFD